MDRYLCTQQTRQWIGNYEIEIPPHTAGSEVIRDCLIDYVHTVSVLDWKPFLQYIVSICSDHTTIYSSTRRLNTVCMKE